MRKPGNPKAEFRDPKKPDVQMGCGTLFRGRKLSGQLSGDRSYTARERAGMAR